MKKVVSVLLCIAFLAGLCSCGGNNEYDTLELTAMNTVMKITVFKNSETDTKKLLDNMRDCIEKIDGLMDVNNPDSDISRVNDAAVGVAVAVDYHTAHILEKALAAYQYTDSLFDVKLLPVITLWGFDNGNYGVPTDADIADALESVGKASFEVNTVDNTVVKHTETQIALGGIAKGYLGDVLLQLAEDVNATALINLGGNIVLAGDKTDGTPWSVGIKNPVDTEGLACSFEGSEGLSVVTSGAYERCFQYGGKTYHHIIDPATGYPANSDLLSVSVIGEEGAVCDALSTALFVGGKEKAIEFTKEFDSYEFILITENNELFYTAGIKNIEVSDDTFTLKEIER